MVGLVLDFTRLMLISTQVEVGVELGNLDIFEKLGPPTLVLRILILKLGFS